MVLLSKLDEMGKGAWIALMVLGFWAFWPLGLALLAFAGFSGRLRSWRRDGPGRWYNAPDGMSSSCGWRGRRHATSGNRAFDDYRTETLKRLEEEQREFLEYLERLRKAKDKAEFDQFMDERRHRPPTAPEAV